MSFGLLLSGDLGNIVLNHFIINYKIVFVMSNKMSHDIIENCEKHEIPFFLGNPRSEEAYNFILNKTCEILISVNYIYLIEKRVIKIAKKIAFNIHGSLLPKYRGRTPHVWAIINGEKTTGITAHIIDQSCDTGPIIEQIEVTIGENETGWDILNKFKILYVPLIESIIKNCNSNKLNLLKQNENNATFYPKRNPEDGIINWNWKSKRIFNWVRAQSNPYPGAYSFYENHKIIIDEVKYLNTSNNKVKNGTIISIQPLIIKTCDGALEITKKRGVNVDFMVNKNLE